MATTATQTVLDTPAVEFRLPATDGKTYALDEVAGEGHRKFGSEAFLSCGSRIYLRYIKMSRKGAHVVRRRVGSNFWRISSVTIGRDPIDLYRPSRASGGTSCKLSWRCAERQCTAAFQAITEGNRTSAAGA
jgi:hypothetical protein